MAIRDCEGGARNPSAAVLAKFLHLETIPADSREWHVNAANAGALADILVREREQALLFRTLATLRTDIPLFDDLDQLRWKGPTPEFEKIAARLDAAVTEGSKSRRRRRADQRIPTVRFNAHPDTSLSFTCEAVV